MATTTTLARPITTERDFQKLVTAPTTGIVVVHFGTPWASHTTSFSRLIEDLIPQNPRVKFYSVDIEADALREVCRREGVRIAEITEALEDTGGTGRRRPVRSTGTNRTRTERRPGSGPASGPRPATALGPPKDGTGTRTRAQLQDEKSRQRRRHGDGGSRRRYL